MEHIKKPCIVSPDDIRVVNGNGKNAIRALLIQLEFPLWKAAKSWGYAGHFGLEEGLHAYNVETFILPAWGLVQPESHLSWLSYARELCHNQDFDQVWLWLVHCEYPKNFLEWVSTLAPIRVGCLYESLTYTREECLHNPKFETRREEVFRQMQGLTHIICSDECDASYIQERGIANAIWSPTFIPSRFVSQEYVSPANSMAAFFGSPYSEERRRWLQEAKLSSLLARPSSPEDATAYPLQFDRLHQTALDNFKRRLPINKEVLRQYVDELRGIRQGAFAAWMNGLSQWNGIVNLPSFGKVYTSRIAEAMAAGSPAISWEVPNRPRNKALFQEGQEILLYQRNQPDQLAQQLLDLQRQPDLARTLVGHAREKIKRYHTAEIRVGQILNWIETGIEPEYGEGAVNRKLDNSADTGSTRSTSKDLSMLSDPQEGSKMSKCLPKEYIQRVGHTRYLDTPGALIYQPHVYALAGFLAERSGAKWIVDIGCGSGEKLQALSKQFRILGIDCSAALNFAKETLSQGRFIEFDLENGLPQLSEEILRDSVVICSDVIEHLKQPERLMQALAGLSEIVPFLLISTPDRDRARGWLDNGPPANPAHVMEWAATEFSRFMKEAGFRDVPFLGHTINTDFHLAKTTLLAVAGTHAMTPSSTKEKFRVAAIIHAYNEVDILPEVVEHLFNEGIEVHVFDNWSNDGSWEIICSLKDLGKVAYAERFPEIQANEYQWHRQLEKTESYATTLDVDWVMHHDADEIRMSPWRGISLKNALAHVHALGYNAVDHTVIDFRFLSNRSSRTAPYHTNLTHFEFGRRPGHFQQIKAWNNDRNIQLASTGGHEVQFEGRRVYPLKFLMKHYPLRNLVQAKKKVLQDRLPRVINEQNTLGWHSQYDQFSQEEMRGWLPKDLLAYHPMHFDTEYLVERISGIGLHEVERTGEMDLLEKRRDVLEFLPKNYTRDVNTNVWKRSEYQGIAYSDGNAIERRLTSIVNNVGDVSLMSIELARQCTDWPTHYHFSNLRANLLRPFEEQLKGKRILEIGAGCGAISRYLGEIEAEVLAVEGSLRRAEIAAKRCQDLGNVTVVAEAAHELSLGQKFDVVTLIGVLEYARKFFPGNSKDPVDAMLEYISGFLKPGGKLFVAIENQMGLKYFAGFPEDHLNQAMFGVEDRYRSDGPVTFGRRELERRLGCAGLSAYQWWYPFPDYKLTRCMVSELGTCYSEDMDLSPIFRQACSQDLQYPLTVSFSPEKALLPIFRNGMLRDMANSFLLVASNVELEEISDIPLAIHYASTRRQEFTKKVVFTRTKEGAPMGYQVPLYPQATAQPNCKLNFRLEHQAFFTGQLWQDQLLNIMTTPNWTFQQLQTWLQVWLNAFLKFAGLTNKADLKEQEISGKFIDLIARNLIIGKTREAKFIDQEWELCENIEVGRVVFRTLHTSFGILPPVANPLERTHLQVIPLIIKLGESVGCNFSIQDINRYLDLERNFQLMASGIEMASNAAFLKQIFLQRGTQIDSHKLLKEREHQLVQLLEAVKERNQEISELKRKLGEEISEHAIVPTCEQAFHSDIEVIECSIIIPVFNKVELTRHCLTQLAEVTQEISFEVVVVDNHSSDGTSQFLETLGGDIKIIRNEENLGFAKGCNQGAQAARGKYLVFLNNDTIPQTGWLDALLEEVYAHPEVSMVGSKLLFPDNTIQHAGIVFNRAKGLPYQWGRGHDSHAQIFNHRREFQAVTGACFLVRREIFERVKGFDEHYVNGYEDVDLCLKVKQLGGKIIYQPKSCLYHLEGQSSGRQDHMKENTAQFLRRWSKVWLEDEDIVLDEEQKFTVEHTPQNATPAPPSPMRNEEKQSSNQLVVDVQKELLGNVKGPLSKNDSMIYLGKILVQYNLWPEDTEILRWGGRVCNELGFHQHGLGFFRRALQLTDDPSLRLQYVQAAVKAGSLEEAQEQLIVVKKSGSFGKEECLVQGVLFLQVKEFLEAKAMFHWVLAEDITHVRARLGLGMSELGQGHGESAFASFQAVLTQWPDHREAIELLLQAGTLLKDWEKLSCQLEKFHTRNPGDCDIRFALAGVYLRMGLFERAKYQLEALQLCAPDYAGLDDLAARLSEFSMAVTDPSLPSAINQSDCMPTLFEPTFSVNNPKKKHVSIILGDPICAQMRLIDPFEACREDLGLTRAIYSGSDVNEDSVHLPVGAEHIWLSQRVDIQDPNIIKAARAQGTRIIRDLDDLLWKIPESNPNRRYMTRPILESFFRSIVYSDCVTVSTEPLKEALASLGIPSVVLPNCLMRKQWIDLIPSRRVGLRPRIGWVGQWGVHLEDLAALIPAMEMLGEEVEWVFLGDIPQGGAGLRCQVETHAMVSLKNFPEKLASLNLDLALAPLAMNEFNEAKSDLRILQYGILGYPVVATDIFPYQAAPVTRVLNDPTSWARAIRDHINNPDSSEAQGEKLRQWVLSHRMFDQWASHYQEAWLGESIKEIRMSESERNPRVSLPESQLQNPGGKVPYDCSIIIPVFNKVDLTSQCLTHLAKVTHGCSYEVIIVDNASTDGTGPFLSSLEGDVQIITNDANLGFAKACNQGAKAANGKYLVFLNNDTIPLEGWLSALVDEIEQHSEVAIVGSKLLYANGTIQHAGVVFSKNLLTPYHLYKRLPSDFNAANLRQEFQAVTAACLLIPKEAFHSVSGFDEQYVNGFEDVDLCLKIRESGQKVVYQPKSVLYHLEEQTPGRKNPEAELKNGRLLMDRWADKIVVDEDVYVVSAGYANRYSTENGKLGLLLETIKSESEKSQWELVKTVQENLLKRRYGQLEQQHGQIDAALRTSLSDASRWPKEMDTLKWAATVCERIEDVDSECSFLKRVLDLGEDREAREKLARYALKRGNLGETSQHVNAILTLNPNDGLGLWLEGILAIQSLEYTKATNSFQQALANGYDGQKTRLGLGMAWIGLGNAQNAWAAFQEVFVADADNKEAVNGLIQSGTMLEWWDKLQTHLTRYLDRNPADCDIRFALAGVQFRAGDSERAKEHLNYLRLVNPDYEGLEDLERLLFSSYSQGNLVSTR